MRLKPEPYYDLFLVDCYQDATKQQFRGCLQQL